MTAIIHRLEVSLAVLVGIGCAGTPPTELSDPGPAHEYVEDPTREPSEAYGKFAGGPDNTHDHRDDLGVDGAKDPFEVLAQRREEGPPEVRTRLHSCRKLSIAALATLLEAFGVDLSATADPPTAGQLLSGGLGALGAADYDARAGEAIVWTTAGAAKLFDVFVAAAPEIIARIESSAHCRLGDKGAVLFDGDRCQDDGVTCLLGRPATPEVLALCDDLVATASDRGNGKTIAVATLLSAAHSCE